MNRIKVVHYINQFFAGIGGEEKADIKPEFRNEIVGPGLALEKQFGEEVEIIGTVICGDSYLNENVEEATKAILEMVKAAKPDMFIAGPAFNAGRYGVACGTIAKAINEELGIPVVTAMYIENPGADMYKKDIHIISTSNSAAGMRKAIKPLAKFALKLAKNETVGSPTEEGYLERGIRKNYFAEKIGAERAVDMLVNKLKGSEFVTEYPMPVFDNVEPGKAIADLSKAKIALVTSGGMVPTGNPDRIESSSASKFGKYEIDNMGETAHGGFDPTYANNNPNVVVPKDALKQLQIEGMIGSIYPYYYSTTGNGTSVKNSKAFAADFAKELVVAGVDGVILTSTWGTCTRCGATMVKEIEKTGIPVVHVCTVVPISLTVGANRIVPAVAIPHPFGNPSLCIEDENKLRKDIVIKALKALTTEVAGQTVFE